MSGKKKEEWGNKKGIKLVAQDLSSAWYCVTQFQERDVDLEIEYNVYFLL